MSDVWKEPFWNSWDRDLDALNGILVAKSIILLQHEGDPFITPPNSTSKQFIDDYGILTLAHDMPPLADKFDRRQEIFWGPGAEARAAWIIIERAPVMKHEGWVTAQEMLSGVPANSYYLKHITAVIERAVSQERESWEQVEALESALTLEAAVALDIEGILVSMCTLAGVTVEGDPVIAVGELHDTLSNEMGLLRRFFGGLIASSRELRITLRSELHMLCLANIQEQMFQFRKTWTSIVKQLSPGRLANEMEFYAKRMDKLADEDKRYEPSNRALWAEEAAFSSLRHHHLVHPDVKLFRKTDEGYVPVYIENKFRSHLGISGLGPFLRF